MVVSDIVTKVLNAYSLVKHCQYFFLTSVALEAQHVLFSDKLGRMKHASLRIK